MLPKGDNGSAALQRVQGGMMSVAGVTSYAPYHPMPSFSGQSGNNLFLDNRRMRENAADTAGNVSLANMSWELLMANRRVNL